MMLRGLSIFIFCAVAMSAEEARWKYGETGLGPKDWGRVWKYCSEKAQSPINIITHTALKNPDLRGLRFTSDNRDGKVSGILSNNGHAPTLSINKIKGTATLTGGPLGKRLYKLGQFHFHFGCKDNRGSEHTLNGYSFSGEIHLVSYNTKYGNFGAAALKPDGLAVIGVFFQESDDEDRDDDEKNSELCKLSKLFRRIKNPEKKPVGQLYH